MARFKVPRSLRIGKPVGVRDSALWRCLRMRKPKPRSTVCMKANSTAVTSRLTKLVPRTIVAVVAAADTEVAAAVAAVAAIEAAAAVVADAAAVVVAVAVAAVVTAATVAIAVIVAAEIATNYRELARFELAPR